MSSMTHPVDHTYDNLPLVEQPSEGVPGVIDNRAQLDAYAAALATGTGPIAADAERASGYRYSQRPYLIQLKRQGAGIGLIDPVSLDDDLSAINAAVAGVPWILHAASQDLPNLRETGIYPEELFDTEVAARLLNRPHVGLGALVAEVLGVRLAKEHAADDWSVRPLPQTWLAYAALDVEFLVPLAERLQVELDEAGKLHIAAAEFQAVLDHVSPPAQDEPWRRVKGLHKLRNARQLAIARALWAARDELGQRLDRSPSRLIPDRSIVAAAGATLSSKRQLSQLTSFQGRAARTELERWWKAIEQGKRDPHPPARKAKTAKTPPPKAWEHRRPLAYQWYNVARADIATLAEYLDVPHEHVLQPATLRDFCWHFGESSAVLAPLTSAQIDAWLADAAARQWQRELVVPILLAASKDVLVIP